MAAVVSEIESGRRNIAAIKRGQRRFVAAFHRKVEKLRRAENVPAGGARFHMVV